MRLNDLFNRQEVFENGDDYIFADDACVDSLGRCHKKDSPSQSHQGEEIFPLSRAISRPPLTKYIRPPK